MNDDVEISRSGFTWTSTTLDANLGTIAYSSWNSCRNGRWSVSFCVEFEVHFFAEDTLFESRLDSVLDHKCVIVPDKAKRTRPLLA